MISVLNFFLNSQLLIKAETFLTKNLIKKTINHPLTFFSIKNQIKIDKCFTRILYLKLMQVCVADSILGDERVANISSSEFHPLENIKLPSAFPGLVSFRDSRSFKFVLKQGNEKNPILPLLKYKYIYFACLSVFCLFVRNQ